MQTNRATGSGTQQVLHCNDSKSLWNYTLSPGWTAKEVDVFRLALMKFGMGRWTLIVESRCLPGKTVAQLNNQAQRMIGQQSTAEFVGLHLDPSDVFKINVVKTGVRKNGTLINTGANPDRATVKLKRTKHDETLSLSKEQVDAIVIPKLDASDLSTVEIVKSSRANTAARKKGANGAREQKDDSLSAKLETLALLCKQLDRYKAARTAAAVPVVTSSSSSSSHTASPITKKKAAKPKKSRKMGNVAKAARAKSNAAANAEAKKAESADVAAAVNTEKNPELSKQISAKSKVVAAAATKAKTLSGLKRRAAAAKAAKQTEIAQEGNEEEDAKTSKAAQEEADARLALKLQLGQGSMSDDGAEDDVGADDTDDADYGRSNKRKTTKRGKAVAAAAGSKTRPRRGAKKIKA